MLCDLQLRGTVSGGFTSLYLKEDYLAPVIGDYIYLTGTGAVIAVEYLVAILFEDCYCLSFT